MVNRAGLPSCRRSNPRWRWRLAQQPDHPAQILCGGCQRERVPGSTPPAQPQSTQLQDAIELRIQHPNLFPVILVCWQASVSAMARAGIGCLWAMAADGSNPICTGCAPQISEGTGLGTALEEWSVQLNPVTPVPEPATLALLSLGPAGLCFTQRGTKA